MMMDGMDKAEWIISMRDKALINENPMNYLDWNKLIQIIEDKQPWIVAIGIMEDQFWTTGRIVDKGKWRRTDRGSYWVRSIWGTPCAWIIENKENEDDDIPPTVLCTTERQYNEETYRGDDSEIFDRLFCGS